MNHGKSADRLLSASTPVAGSVELHSMTMEGNVMRMREVEGGIALAPGATVALQPGSLHMMFMNLKQPLALGTKVPVTLQFEKAGKVTVSFVVKAQPPGGMPMHQH
ncbi:MAG: copper chaperone PCu(A)C, partial [Betaproteobacteria bacterium]|nr:copper chaperone PCu(A)C [Betaproteobacteria bacterium]